VLKNHRPAPGFSRFTISTTILNGTTRAVVVVPQTVPVAARSALRTALAPIRAADVITRGWRDGNGDGVAGRRRFGSRSYRSTLKAAVVDLSRGGQGGGSAA